MTDFVYIFKPVADPGFDLRGRGLCKRGGGRKSSESVLG